MFGDAKVLSSKEFKLSILKGWLFEIVIRQMLLQNGFSQVPLDNRKSINARAVLSRDNFIELKGRGGWHQIDCPCDLNYCSPFMFPIRLLGEVKFTKKKVDKAVVRQYIGVLRDIQENYFVTNPKIVRDNKPKRVLEVGCIFSANGFDAQAENLAYAHGIKTISYENNVAIDRIKQSIEKLVEENAFLKDIDKVGKYLKSILNQFFQNGERFVFRDSINFSTIGGFVYYDVGEIFTGDYIQSLSDLLNDITTIRGNFIATTPEGLLLHFVGEKEFPYNLFNDSDHAQYRLHIEKSNRTGGGDAFFLSFVRGNGEYGKFYFSSPDVLKKAIKENWKQVLDVKQRFLYKLVVHKEIKGMHRTLILDLDNNWVWRKQKELR